MAAATSVVTVDAGITHQTMTGWEVTARAGQDSPLFPLFRDELFDLAVDDLGLNRVRVEVNSGSENTHDFFPERAIGNDDLGVWQCRRFYTTNDNNDPFLIDSNGFHFSFLDWHVENVALPMKQRLEARGERLFVNVNYVSFVNNKLPSDCRTTTPNDHANNPEEYAEFVLATYQHLQEKYNIVPDAWEVILEPDNTSRWRGVNIGRAIVAAGQRLAAHGFTPRFIAPSTANMTQASTYFDQMIGVPGVLPFLSEVSYHRYGGASQAALQAIAERAEQYQLATAMLEHIGSDYRDLHEDLKIGGNSAWQQFTLANVYQTGSFDDKGFHAFWVETGGSGPPIVHLAKRTWLLRQYFRHIRAGAVRIEATSNDPRVDPLAFVNPDGRQVVVIKTEGAGSFSITGLSDGVYQITASTGRGGAVEAERQVINPGEVINVSMPGAGVMTVFGVDP